MKEQEFNYLPPAAYGDHYDHLAEEERRNELGNEFLPGKFDGAVVGMGSVATLGFFEGDSVNENTTEQEQPPITIEQARALGAAPLGQLVEFDRAGHNALTNEAVLGYAEQRVAA